MTPPAASAAAPAIHPRRTVGPRRPAAAPRRPRRVSGPARPARNPARRINDPARLAEAVASNRLLDRLISGRIWIGVIAFALIGIVTMQLGLLKLNAGIGRSLAREALLQRENATLSTENSEMAAGERIEAQAGQAGMELIPSGALRFLAAHPSLDASKGAAVLSASALGAATARAQALTPASATAEASTPEASTPAGSGSEAVTPASTESGSSPQTNAQPSATPEATAQTGATAQAATPAKSTTPEAPPADVHTEASSGGAGEAAAASSSTPAGGGTTPGG